jgi:hypothetical protein
MSDQPNDEYEQKARAERAKAFADQKAAADAKAKSAADANAKTTTDRAKVTSEEAAARIAAAQGAQVVLDPAGNASLGARGALAPTMQENVLARDEDLIKMGFNPHAPSNHLTDPPPKPAA